MVCALGLIVISALAWGWTVFANWHHDKRRQAIESSVFRGAYVPCEMASFDREAVRGDLQYYLDTHNVQDEGFGMMAAVSEELGIRNDKSEITAQQPTTHFIPNSSFLIPNSSQGRGFVEVGGTTWKSGYRVRMRRVGWGSSVDSAGVALTGYWRCDTIVIGTRRDTLGAYTGPMLRSGLAQGHGRWVGRSGTLYAGAWDKGLRDGFGVQFEDGTMRVGLWKGDKFKGEKMTYTSERIYGIDISRYQHESARPVYVRRRTRRGRRLVRVRRTYPIAWDKLRITRLAPGTAGVSFPVSFVYIKSTEGTSIRNRYFATDYRAARARGIRVGAYHFFSTKSGGALQASFFIKSTAFRAGDFPPVLDVEPTKAQVAAMGGQARLRKEILAWMNAVERHTGCRPILYVGQSFVKRYISQWPDIRAGYNIWIARYGEYRPDVRLAIWQLTPKGRVAGIQGDVDINVFNGYKETFEKFKRQSTI